MTRVIGSYAIKGGVGKTATVVNLAYLAAREGAQTLIWDLDPQGAVSFYYRIKPDGGGGVKRLLLAKDRLRAAIRSTDYPNLDLLPADVSHRKFDRVLHGAEKPHRLIASRLASLAREYDYVFLDCPAGLSLLSESVLRAMDALIVPVIPTPLSLRTYRQLVEFLARKGSRDLLLLPFYSMCDRRKSLHGDIMARGLEGHTRALQAHVPYTVDVERMGVKRMPVDCYAGASDAAAAYRDLWAEIKQHLYGRRRT
jgi:chromosome partitioning protein